MNQICDHPYVFHPRIYIPAMKVALELEAYSHNFWTIFVIKIQWQLPKKVWIFQESTFGNFMEQFALTLISCLRALILYK